jgi:hypothetical protein
VVTARVVQLPQGNVSGKTSSNGTTEETLFMMVSMACTIASVMGGEKTAYTSSQLAFRTSFVSFPATY